MHLARTYGTEVSVGAVSLASRNEKEPRDGNPRSCTFGWPTAGGRAPSPGAGTAPGARPALPGDRPRAPAALPASLRASELGGAGGAGRCRAGGAGRGGNKAKAPTLPRWFFGASLLEDAADLLRPSPARVRVCSVRGECV